MERIVYNKTLDTHKSGVQFTLQGFETADKMARRIVISLMANGDTIDLPLGQMEAVMYVTSPNGTEPSINSCTIKGNTIIYDVLPITEEGIATMQLKLIEASPDGTPTVLATPRFAVEVIKSDTDDEGIKDSVTYSAVEEAIARAKAVYEKRLLRIALHSDCMFYAYYADGTIYESDVLKELFLKGDALLSQSYAKGGTGVRDGEETDNAMYYCNTAISASIESQAIKEDTQELLKEARLHGVYTSFSIDFETGEVEYVSPHYSFKINTENGDLEAEGEAYTFEDNILKIVDDWIKANSADIKKWKDIETDITEINETIEAHSEDISDLKVTTDKLLKYCRIQAGTYEGKGTCGESNQTEFTFDFEPQILFIQKNDTDICSYVIRGNNQAYIPVLDRMVAVIWEGKTVSLCSNNIEFQFNTLGATYSYVAIGYGGGTDD
jgi:hypothetical protein